MLAASYQPRLAGRLKETTRFGPYSEPMWLVGLLAPHRFRRTGAGSRGRRPVACGADLANKVRIVLVGLRLSDRGAPREDQQEQSVDFL